MYFKIAVLKNFAITVKKFLLKMPAFLLKKRLQHRCFLRKSLRTAFFVEHLTVHSFYYFEILCDDRFFGRIWVQN